MPVPLQRWQRPEPRQKGQTFVREVTRRYAYVATRAELEGQGFTLVDEETAEDGRLHLTLRRTA